MDASKLLKAMILVADFEKKQERCSSKPSKQQIAIIRTTTKVMFIGESVTGAKLAKYLKENANK